MWGAEIWLIVAATKARIKQLSMDSTKHMYNFGQSAAMADALDKIKDQQFRDGMRLAKIDVYRHILEMVTLGCESTELSQYLAACIRSEVSRLPKDIVK